MPPRMYRCSARHYKWRVRGDKVGRDRQKVIENDPTEGTRGLRQWDQEWCELHRVNTSTTLEQTEPSLSHGAQRRVVGPVEDDQRSWGHAKRESPDPTL